ncbi:hypothetical protein EP331_03960 [bacterium]|nr:MAG: hypothetical protein EP331_03960 [bacterium]
MFPLALVNLIHKNLSTVLQFVYSRNEFIELRQVNIVGNWPQLDEVLFNEPEKKANRAIVELALHLRILDDDQKLNDYINKTNSGIIFGTVIKKTRETEKLTLRDVSNKIIHCKKFDWDLTNQKDSKIICYSDNNDEKSNWVRADINITALAAFCGMLR